MKKLLLFCSLVVMLLGLTSFNAAALQMTGGISFTGNFATDTGNVATANAFTSFTEEGITSGSGTWLGIPSGNSTNPQFTPFTFNPPANVPSLWSFLFGGVTYSFDASGASMAFTRHGGPTPDVTVEGFGMVLASAGYDPTPGFFKITAQEGGGTVSFSSSSVTVPEPGTLLLLGFGLVGFAGLRRKFKK